MKLLYSPEYVGAAYSFETTRKAAWVVDSLAASPIACIEMVSPTPLTREEVEEVHDPAYVRAVQTGEPRHLAESQGFDWDPGLWRMVLASNGGAVAAALVALDDGVAGSLSSGLHHARRAGGAGFCTFNGLVLAARRALAAGAASVLIVDLDAHCGGGTASLIASEPRIWQVDVAVNSFDHYDVTARDTAGDRLWLEYVTRSDDYLAAVRRGLGHASAHGPAFDLCLYNAGMDPHQDSSTGGLRGITTAILAERERLVFEWARDRGVPIAFVIAGGYVSPRLDAPGLVALHRLTLATAAETAMGAAPGSAGPGPTN